MWRRNVNLRRIRSLVESFGKDLWVGFTDRDSEQKWTFVTNNEEFDPNEGNTLFQWEDGEPNDSLGSQDCARIWYKNGYLSLDDYHCWINFFGLCEIKNFWALFFYVKKMVWLNLAHFSFNKFFVKHLISNKKVSQVF